MDVHRQGNQYPKPAIPTPLLAAILGSSTVAGILIYLICFQFEDLKKFFNVHCIYHSLYTNNMK